MHSVVAIQVVARSFVWIFLFSIEVIAINALNMVRGNYVYYLIAILIVVVEFSSLKIMGDDYLLQDIREICVYEISLNFFGLLFYICGMNQINHIGLNYAIIFLKFGRLLWPYIIFNGSKLSHWPVFGLLGLLAQRKGVRKEDKQQPTFARNIIYLYIITCICAGYSIALLGWQVKLSHLSVFPLLAIPYFYKNIIQHLTAQHQAQMQHQTELAVQQATTAAALRTAAEQMRLGQELADKNRQLEGLIQENQIQLRELAAFNAAMRDASHDLKQPMFVVSSRAESLINAKQADQQQVAAAALRDGLLLLQEYIDDVIYNAKVATKIHAPSIEVLSIWQILHEVRDDFLKLANEKDLYLGLYPLLKRGSSKELFVTSDRVLLNRIVRNIVVNALLHTQQGGILLSARRRERHCLFQIWDTGPGIAVATAMDGQANFNAFTEWARQHGGRYGSDGHGLGMNNVLQLCQALGIQMHLHSRPGRGSVFSFYLPLA